MLFLLTHNIIPKTNGAEGNEGEIEALAERPAFHVTEQQRRDDQDQQAARDEEQAHRQSLHRVLGNTGSKGRSMMVAGSHRSSGVSGCVYLEWNQGEHSLLQAA